MFFLPKEYLELVKEEQLIEKECGYLDKELVIPGVKGKVLVISDQSDNVMYQSLELVMERVKNISYKLKHK